MISELKFDPETKKPTPESGVIPQSLSTDFGLGKTESCASLYKREASNLVAGQFAKVCLMTACHFSSACLRLRNARHNACKTTNAAVVTFKFGLVKS